MTERGQTATKDLGLLVLRVGVGATFALFGWRKWQGGKDYAHALNMMIVFAALLVAGGGRFALGARIPGLRGKWFG